MIPLALFLVILCGQSFGMYQPGTPGAKWTEAEILAVKNRCVETLIVVSKSFVNDAVFTRLQIIMQDPEGALKQVPGGAVSGLNGTILTGEEIFERWDNEIPESSNLRDGVLPDPANIIRLTFHDCLVDSETGGCNG